LLTLRDYDLKKLENTHSELIANFIDFTERAKDYRESIKPFLDSLFGSGELFNTEGLKVKLKCGWVGEEIRKTQKSICS